jgi:hypothetical protein
VIPGRKTARERRMPQPAPAQHEGLPHFGISGNVVSISTFTGR